jgi:DNA-binding NarL/FixJ family response regulator
MTNKGIADALTISRRTVDGQRILRKLDFSSRTQVASWVASVAGQPAARPDSGRTVST